MPLRTSSSPILDKPPGASPAAFFMPTSFRLRSKGSCHHSACISLGEGVAALRNGAHIGVAAIARRKGFNMELFVSIIACLLFAPGAAMAVMVYVGIVRDAAREERDFYAAQAARQHGEG